MDKLNRHLFQSIRRLKSVPPGGFEVLGVARIYNDFQNKLAVILNNIRQQIKECIRNERIK